MVWKLATRPRFPTWYQQRINWPKNASVAGSRRTGQTTGWSGRRVHAKPATAEPGTSIRSTARTTFSLASHTGARPSGSMATALLGAVYYPAVDQLWLGGRESPTTLNGEPVPTLLNQPLSEVSVATYLHPRHLGDRQRVAAWQSVIASAATVRILGSASIDMAEVASSRLGVFLQANLNAWDWYQAPRSSSAQVGLPMNSFSIRTGWQIAGNAQAVEDVKTALQS